MTEISMETLKTVLSYAPESGVFTRKNSNGVMAGYLQSKGYIQIRVLGKAYLAHRLAWLYMHGQWPPNQIDHINHVRTDNRICNLRAVTHIENTRNRKRYSSNSSSICGVYWVADRKIWRTAIRIEGKERSIGNYIDYFEAVCARKSAESHRGYHKNHGSPH